MDGRALPPVNGSVGTTVRFTTSIVAPVFYGNNVTGRDVICPVLLLLSPQPRERESAV